LHKAQEAKAVLETGPAEPASAPDARPGDRLPGVPGYEVLGVLGKGGMGVVYKARHLGLDRIVALKVLGETSDPGGVRRFVAEAKKLARTHAPTGVVQVYDNGTHEGLLFYAMEFCEGGSLAERLRGGPLPPLEAASLVRQVARA